MDFLFLAACFLESSFSAPGRIPAITRPRRAANVRRRTSSASIPPGAPAPRARAVCATGGCHYTDRHTHLPESMTTHRTRWDVMAVGANSVDYVYRLPAPPQIHGPRAKMGIGRHPN